KRKTTQSRVSTVGPLRARAIFRPAGAYGLGPQATRTKNICVSTIRPIAPSIALKPTHNMPSWCKHHTSCPFHNCQCEVQIEVSCHRQGHTHTQTHTHTHTHSLSLALSHTH